MARTALLGSVVGVVRLFAGFLAAFVTTQVSMMRVHAAAGGHAVVAPGALRPVASHGHHRRFTVSRLARVTVSVSSLMYLLVAYMYHLEGDVPSAALFCLVTVFSVLADGKWVELHCGDRRGIVHACDRWTALAGTVRALCSPYVLESAFSASTTAAACVLAMYCLHTSRRCTSPWRWVAWHTMWHVSSALAIVFVSVQDWRRHVWRASEDLEPL